MRRVCILYILICFLLIQDLRAQNMIVEKMEQLSLDLSASTNPRKDFNGNICALIKVSMTVSNATFGGSVIGDVLRDGSDYWVYMPEGSKMLQIKHPNYKTMMVAFPNYGIEYIEGKRTYLLNISLPYVEMLNNQYTIHENVEKEQVYTPKIFSRKKIKDYKTAFFPIFGITPGQTTIADAKKLGYNPDETGLLKLQDTYVGISSVLNDVKDKYNHIQITSASKIQDKPKMPKKWSEEFGFDMSLSYNEWYNLFSSLGFRIDVKKEPRIEEYDERNVLRGEFRATEPLGRFYFDLIFSAYNLNNEVISVNSPNSLLSLNLLYIEDPEMSRKLERTKNSSKNYKEYASIKTLFPIYGVTLGKSTWYDMARAGYSLKTYDSSVFADVLSLGFADYEGKGYFDKLYFTASDMPSDWIKLGFQKGNSYETWLKLLDEMGYTIIVTKEPEVGSYEGVETLNAEFTAISEDAHLKMEFEFRYGENGSSLSSPGTLYSISMTVQ